LKTLFNISILILLTLSSCFRDEQPRPELPLFVQNITTARESNGQVYYSLKDRKILKSNSIYSWDLAFSCRDGDFEIIVNSAKKMGVNNTRSKEFDVSYQPEHKYYAWTYDHPTGEAKNNCFGAWGDFTFDNPQSFGDVYVVNRGFDKFNLPYQLKKLRIDGFKNNAYEITFADVDGDTFYRLTVPKNDSFNFVYVSLEQSGRVFQLEPYKENWDLLFSNYIDSTRYSNVYTKSDSINSNLTLFDGVLLNPYNHSAAIDTSKGFNAIGFFDVEDFEYLKARNTIGNRWYDWNDKNKKYILSDVKTFVVKHGRLRYYVIEFTDVDKPRRDELQLRFAIKNL